MNTFFSPVGTGGGGGGSVTGTSVLITKVNFTQNSTPSVTNHHWNVNYGYVIQNGTPTINLTITKNEDQSAPVNITTEITPITIGDLNMTIDSVEKITNYVLGSAYPSANLEFYVITVINDGNVVYNDISICKKVTS